MYLSASECSHDEKSDLVGMLNAQRKDNGKYCDLTLQLVCDAKTTSKPNSFSQEIYVHTCFLAALLGKSFETRLDRCDQSNLDKEDASLEIQKYKKTLKVPAEFRNIVDFCYTGKFAYKLMHIDKTIDVINEMVADGITKTNMLEELDKLKETQYFQNCLEEKACKHNTTTIVEIGQPEQKQENVLTHQVKSNRRKMKKDPCFIYYTDKGAEDSNKEDGFVQDLDCDMIVHSNSQHLDDDTSFQEEIFKCESCNRCFINFASLSAHKEICLTATNIHSKAHRENGQSNLCSKWYSDNMYSKLESLRSFVAQCCGEVFYNKFRYGVHIIQCHSVLRVKCSACSEFVNIESIVSHYEVEHNFIRVCQRTMERHLCNFSTDMAAIHSGVGSDGGNLDPTLAMTKWNEKTHCQYCNKTMTILEYVQHVQEQCMLTKHSFMWQDVHKKLKCIYAQCLLCPGNSNSVRLWKLLKCHVSQYHLRNSQGDKRENCDQCGHSVLKHKLKLHKKNHNNFVKKELISCDICGKSINKKRISVHRRTHFDQFVCQYCKKIFNRKENLNVHVKIHTGEKPYVCDICGKGFRQYVELRLHNRQHEKISKKNKIS